MRAQLVNAFNVSHLFFLVYPALPGRSVHVINMDPANDYLPYPCSVNINDLIRLDEVMAGLSLGPNGGLVFCMDYLNANRDWLVRRLTSVRKRHPKAYFIFDCPGQVELYTHHPGMRELLTWLTSSPRSCHKSPSSSSSRHSGVKEFCSLSNSSVGCLSPNPQVSNLTRKNREDLAHLSDHQSLPESLVTSPCTPQAQALPESKKVSYDKEHPTFPDKPITSPLPPVDPSLGPNIESSGESTISSLLLPPSSSSPSQSSAESAFSASAVTKTHLDSTSASSIYTASAVSEDFPELSQSPGLRLTCVQLVDSHYCTDPGKFIACLLTCLCGMLQLGLPHVNVLSKIDLIERYGSLEFNLDYFTEVLDLKYLVEKIHVWLCNKFSDHIGKYLSNLRKNLDCF
ncbi:unnamed protein product [Protopolystoma xenopodis]|uniref:GPN-loop GTPase n=1 Tax=Protopolystoma xenopodis TaxID=117903 RepID=A0A448WFA7_9PLAT|nr:unnamed protein product [Protopolystoma xenopodis]